MSSVLLIPKIFFIAYTLILLFILLQGNLWSSQVESELAHENTEMEIAAKLERQRSMW